uniref:glucuronosyltransferase n=1 Tax=Ditylenchus dipsaci TaxID=166011 RepID=A0A915DLM2_9BILA
MAFSHMQFQGRLADVLVEAGHEVHILMLNIDQQWANYTGSTKAQKVLRIDRPQNNKMAMEELREELLPNPFKYVDSGAKMWSGFNRFLAGFCEDLVNNKELMDSLKAEKYDVGIAEMYSPCVFAIFHYIGVKTKLASYAIPLTGMADIMRPTINGANMEFWQRAVNLYTNIEEILTVRNEDIEIMQPIVNNAFSSSFPSMKEIRKNISLIFVNSDLLLEHPHPISNKVINIGGIVRSKGKPLCKKIKTILDSSDKGTVLFSLGSGTNTSLMSIEMKKAFLGAFSLFPDHSFLWKFDLHDNDKKLFSSVANVYCFNWLDQKTIIEHPKLVAFMTHCGMNSMNEAALAGVPIIALPLFGDQLHNAALMVERGVAEYINILEAEDEKIIVNALQKILYQPIRLHQKKSFNIQQLNKAAENCGVKSEFKSNTPSLACRTTCCDVIGEIRIQSNTPSLACSKQNQAFRCYREKVGAVCGEADASNAIRGIKLTLSGNPAALADPTCQDHLDWVAHAYGYTQRRPKFDNYTGANKANKIIRVDRPESRSKSNAMDELIELDNPFLGYNNALNGFLTWTKLEADNCEAEVFYDENGASKIKSILDNSASGVVLLSFGSLTNTSKMTYQMKKSYLTAFAHFPTHDFIWKLKPGDNETAMFASVPNVHLVDWLNQKAILEHPNLKVFMTHCGMNSMNEVALAGVPVIALPLFGDQLHNAAVTVNKKIGVYAPIDQTDDPQILIDALNKVLNQPKYKENAKLLQKKLKISPFTPEEKFVKWVEFAAEFPNLNELNLPFDELGFLAYYCLDAYGLTKRDQVCRLQRMPPLCPIPMGHFKEKQQCFYLTFFFIWNVPCCGVRHQPRLRPFYKGPNGRRFEYQCTWRTVKTKTTAGALALHLISAARAPFGIPVINLFAPTIDGPNMNFVQRAMNLFANARDTLSVRHYSYQLAQPIVNKAFGADFPSLREIIKNVSLVFINSNEFFELPHPISNKVQYVGGIVKSKAKPLSQEINSILDNSASGVVLLSFGSLTNTSKMTNQMKKSYLNAFAHFPTYDFIWKLKPGDNESAIFASVPNVHVVNWFDQKAVLAGVPLIALPLFGDQLYNAAIIVNKGIGEFVPIQSTHDPKVLIDALKKVLSQPKYKENAKVLQKKLKISPFKPEEKLVKWVEFAAEFPNLNELNLPFDELGFIAYYCLDLK